MHEEPTKRGSRVLDRDGDTWRRGLTRWTCEAPVDGYRIMRISRLHWGDLDRKYGPLVEIERNDR